LKDGKLTSARAMVEVFKMEGTEYVFCVPGESYLPLLDALYDEPGIRVITNRHEGGAAFMAEGYAKASLKPGVVLATRGVGAANLAIGVHTARHDSTPMVVILGQVDSRFRGREGFQEVELAEFFRPLAKWSVEIRDPARVPELMHRAFHIAQTGRPGPVVVSIPEDLFLAESDYQFSGQLKRPSPGPSREELDLAGQQLERSERPAVIAGGGVKWAQAEEDLIRFAEKFSLPVLTAFRRHDVFPNDHPLYAGHLGLGTPREILETVRKADLVIAIGTRLSEITTQDYSLFSGQKLIHIDIDAENIGTFYRPILGIVSDAGEALRGLLSLKADIRWKEWAAERNAFYKRTTELTLNEKASLYAHGIELLRRLLPRDALITNDAGNFAGWLHRYYSFRQKNTYVGPTSGAMGYGLPAALGAKLAHPERVVCSLSGDGGFLMTFQELETAVREQIPVIAIVFNNKMYGTIRMHQEIHFPGRVIATDLGDVSFHRLAESLGARGFTVNSAGEFAKALKESLRSSLPCVIEVKAEPEQISVTETITSLRRKN
jgi:acetolactate synthase, large subunit (EC 2.2.1.6)